MAALEGGDGAAAREAFSSLIDAGFGTVPMRLMLVRACKFEGNLECEAAALDALLEASPDNLSGLLLRADCHRRSENPRATAAFFQRALDRARSLGPQSPEIVADLRSAQDYINAQAREFSQSIRDAVATLDRADGLRLSHTVEILNGERDIHPQQPSVLYVPYLLQRQYFERDEFEWAAALEDETTAIHDELAALLEADAEFRPYVEAEADRPRKDFAGLLDDPSWSAFYLWKDGALVEENAARCPRTVAALGIVPLSRIGSRTPSVLFSMLRPGAHIPPHHGMLNSRLICHLPLIVPAGCWLRVGNERREVEAGRMMIFDDSIEHEAKNESDQTRIILLFDIWRPELSEHERTGISAIFDAIDRFSGLPDA
ncbi:aspartyl/asparaginyl beta-hydroxylase domain-containing protein [Sphingomonas sp. LY29]|uniref:aspartyl/asparaginyl beta-hydroxylase domain-containing protein n=1 Tax=Sphingomonas sp. LY29 TaxID=3095341 RepID=UPI002D774B6E|nr:aspartyl/asparaginyl beta-hydroxylase domain-containing protein [Sphingomonas sp. LY29]WRP26792.1 aspartyl/asparaginyl beta-hydroxylase domain-containing protein [Sphingomonas sp. LY29]